MRIASVSGEASVPFQEVSVVSQRREFIELAKQEGANRRQLCRRFTIARSTGYKWLGRDGAAPRAEPVDRSRRPHHSPGRTAPAMEAKVVALRRQHPCWGGRKLHHRLVALSESGVPSASTITEILRRHGLLEAAESARHAPSQRFEREEPNELWQMDFKGHIPLAAGRCHPLTVLDDHSRYALTVAACADELGATVERVLSEVFRRYGLPERMLMDNGAPWGNAEAPHAWTCFSVWLLRLGVAVSHGRPYHPQTQGKDERFHRTLLAEAIGARHFHGLEQCQRAFEAWRHVYNHERPHEALHHATPASRYRLSPREFPERLPAIEYAPDLAVRRVQKGGWFGFAGRQWHIAKSFAGQPVALRPTRHDGCYEVLFCQHRIAAIDLNETAP